MVVRQDTYTVFIVVYFRNINFPSIAKNFNPLRKARGAKSGGRAGWGCSKVIVVSALQAPQVHGSVTALDGYPREDVREHNPVLIRLLLLDVITDVLGEHGGKSLVVGTGHDFLRLVIAQYPFNQ